MATKADRSEKHGQSKPDVQMQIDTQMQKLASRRLMTRLLNLTRRYETLTAEEPILTRKADSSRSRQALGKSRPAVQPSEAAFRGN